MRPNAIVTRIASGSVSQNEMSVSIVRIAIV